MDNPIAARTVSRTVLNHLREGPFTGQTLVTFEHACDLLAESGEIIALVDSRVGNGPLNIVVNESLKPFENLEAGTPAVFSEDGIRAGELTVDLEEAIIWDPRPEWNSLRTHKADFVDQLSTLRRLCREYAPGGSFLALMEPTLSCNPAHNAVLARARQALYALEVGWAGDVDRLREGTIQLAGLGSGLTPSGDDFLIGVMLATWLVHPKPTSICHPLANFAAPLTTPLSAAFLHAAAQGECSEAWHILLAAIAGENDTNDAEIAGALHGVLAHGATSGADALAGFLWVGIGY
jgi:hypothetical protein